MHISWELYHMIWIFINVVKKIKKVIEMDQSLIVKCQ